jgi:hypothetical protein
MLFLVVVVKNIPVLPLLGFPSLASTWEPSR